MKIGRWFLLLAGIGLALSSGLVSAQSGGYTVKVGGALRQLHPGETIVSMSAKVSCLAVTDVRRVPDGWSLSLDARGEEYLVQLARNDAEDWLVALGTQERAASNREVGEFAFRVGFRGQWSDCGGVGLTVHVLGADGGATYNFLFEGGKTWTLEGRQSE